MTNVHTSASTPRASRMLLSQRAMRRSFGWPARGAAAASSTGISVGTECSSVDTVRRSPGGKGYDRIVVPSAAAELVGPDGDARVAKEAPDVDAQSERLPLAGQ